MSNEDSNHIHVHDAVVHVEDTVSTFSRIDSGIVNTVCENSSTTRKMLCF